MKKTPVFYLKTVMAILGFLAFILSSVLPILKEITYDYNYIGSGRVYYISAIKHPLWYLIIVATAIVFTLGYFFNQKVNIVLVFVFAPLFAIGIAVATFLFTFRLSLFGPSVKIVVADGYKLAVCGALLITVASCISVLRKNQRTTTPVDLLDS